MSCTGLGKCFLFLQCRSQQQKYIDKVLAGFFGLYLLCSGIWLNYIFSTPHFPPELLYSPSLSLRAHKCIAFHINFTLSPVLPRASVSPATLVKTSVKCAQSLTCNPFCSCLSLNLVSLAPEVNVAGGELVGKSTTSY